jgi:CspA family cold shock protein
LRQSLVRWQHGRAAAHPNGFSEVLDGELAGKGDGKETSRVGYGRVLQFDQTRGFGFITAEDGEEDVFLHASVFNGHPDMLVPGALIEFQIMAGGRGRKAYDARLADEEWEKTPADNAPVPAPAPEALPADNDDQMCDVLSDAEFGQELTELLNAVPEWSEGWPWPPGEVRRQANPGDGSACRRLSALGLTTRPSGQQGRSCPSALGVIHSAVSSKAEFGASSGYAQADCRG